MPDNLASIQAVSKRFPNAKTPALEKISGEIRAGEIYGLVGADGAGKTTLLRLLAGLLELESGFQTFRGAICPL